MTRGGTAASLCGCLNGLLRLEMQLSYSSVTQALVHRTLTAEHQ